MNEILFEKARGVAMTLKEAGHEVYFAGGCVRDRLLGRPPKDFDIATSARPEQVKKLFRRTIGVGAHFGVMIVLVGEDQFDVATFRSDGAYGDGRRPDEIRFTSAEEDVARRDFTVNGLLMDPETLEVIDHVGGRPDMEARLIRTIGRAEDRFAEDHLRILRALRFACSLEFEIESGTAAAIRKLADRADRPSPERILSELDRMFCERSPARALDLLDDLGLLRVVLPELAQLGGREADRRLQPAAGESLDLLTRKKRILRRLLPPIDGALVWSILLGDLDATSPRASARAAIAVLKRLRASNDLLRRVALLVSSRDRLLFASRVTHCRLRLVQASPDREVISALHRLEAAGAARSALAPRPKRIDPAELPPPLLRGDELVTLGLPRGPALGRVMRRLRFLQLDGRLEGPEEARAWVTKRLSGHAGGLEEDPD